MHYSNHGCKHLSFTIDRSPTRSFSEWKELSGEDIRRDSKHRVCPNALILQWCLNSLFSLLWSAWILFPSKSTAATISSPWKQTEDTLPSEDDTIRCCSRYGGWLSLCKVHVLWPAYYPRKTLHRYRAHWPPFSFFSLDWFVGTFTQKQDSFWLDNDIVKTLCKILVLSSVSPL